ncbi:MAG TPA: hypothetical protein VFH38_07335 [Jatrophihabitans sp.]|nr:hypothetical protein [Jatrophihabitans sp.]
MRLLDRLATHVVRRTVDVVLDRLDLTRIVLERVDVARVVDAVDPDPVAARVDIDAIIARIDLVGIAQMIVDEIDLPGIIRGSTTSMASESVTGIRLQSAAADERLNELMSRLKLRRRTDARVPPSLPAASDGGRDAGR